MISALQELPGTLVYPFTAAVGLVLTVAVARVAWRERFGGLGAAGIALAVRRGRAGEPRGRLPMKVKASPGDFRVEEVSSLAISDQPGPYAVYRLEKTSWDTFALLDLLARRLGV